MMNLLVRWLKGTPVVVVAVVIISWQLMTPFGSRNMLNRLDYIFYDWRAQMATWVAPAAGKVKKSEVVIVDIDERSIQQEGRWPWSRYRVAHLVEQLQLAGASVIAFDVVFSEAENNKLLISKLEESATSAGQRAQIQSLVNLWQPDEDLASAINQLDTVLGFFMNRETDSQVGMLPGAVAELPSNNVLLSAKGYMAPLEGLQAAALGGGFVTTFPDMDGVIRRTPLLMNYKQQAYPSLALAAVMAYLLTDEITLNFQTVGEIAALAQVSLTKQPIQTDALGRVLVPFYQSGHHFPYLSAGDVLTDTFDHERVAGKIVFIGTSSIGLADLVNTPFTTSFPGVEVHGLVAQGLLGGGFPFRPVWIPGALFSFQCVLVFGLIWAFARRRPLTMVMAALSINLLLVAGNLLSWIYWHIELPFVSTFVLVQLLFGWYLVMGFIREHSIERRIRGMFAQYIPPAHIEQMLSSPEDYSMAGESKELTVLFSDIRSFTTISEKLSATQLKQLLNVYFTPITEAIFRNDGTIDKYVGDMVMAFWGAPVDDPDHRIKALKTALEMQRITKALTPTLAAQGLPPVQIGIGLNTGLMNVGDMGSEYRKAYTVLGDAVNLGSRLESLTKFYGVEILVGEATIEGCDDIVFRFCDRIVVKGKQFPVDAFEPLGLRVAMSEQQMAQLSRFNVAIEFYRQQQWDLAIVELKVLHQLEPHCKLYSLYLDRIELLRHEKLPADWDGVYTHTSK